MSKLNNSPVKEKKEQTDQKKKNKRSPIHLITYSCVCGAKFKTVSTSPQDISTSSCSQCNPFYTGVPLQERKIGAVAKFRQKFEHPKKS